MTPVVFPPTPPSPTLKGPDDTALREAAVAFEASFLAEMLNAAGLGKTRMSFGGGTGEDQFASFLVQEQATQMARAGGIGLAESIFQALKARDDG
ncbi:rod-binding protein [Aestuariivita boseongensis]|uniref:rod-binding protein n=1 Tax=Aestuariivita boseongensis TaxID=1470562 RepID=UPI000681FAE9|nr:rod-binding protein [Aestuariivita boseongensis]